MTALSRLLIGGYHMRRGEQELAMSHLQSGLASAQWDKSKAVYQSNDWCVYLDDSLDRWHVFVDPVGQRTFLSEETWETISFDGDAQADFIRDYVRAEGVSGMQFIVQDAGAYGRAARAEAAAYGTDEVDRKDRLTVLAEKANGLLVQAASLNSGATEGQSQIFAVRYAKLREEFEALSDELDRVRGLVDLAGTAVLDAVS